MTRVFKLDPINCPICGQYLSGPSAKKKHLDVHDFDENQSEFYQLNKQYVNNDNRSDNNNSRFPS